MKLLPIILLLSISFSGACQKYFRVTSSKSGYLYADVRTRLQYIGPKNLIGKIVIAGQDTFTITSKEMYVNNYQAGDLSIKIANWTKNKFTIMYTQNEVVKKWDFKLYVLLGKDTLMNTVSKINLLGYKYFKLKILPPDVIKTTDFAGIFGFSLVVGIDSLRSESKRLTDQMLKLIGKTKIGTIIRISGLRWGTADMRLREMPAMELKLIE